jgi:hypothetical protein
MQSFECVVQQHPAAAFQRAEHTARFAPAVAGLHTADAESLQVADGVGAALVFGLMWSTSRARWCSWAPQHAQRHWARMSTLYFTEPLIGVLAEGVEALAAQLL